MLRTQKVDFVNSVRFIITPKVYLFATTAISCQVHVHTSETRCATVNAQRVAETAGSIYHEGI